MEFIFSLILSIFLILGYGLLKNTVFGINLKTGNYLGFFIFYDLIIYVIPSTLLLNYFLIEKFWVAYKVKQDSIIFISILITVLLLVYFLILKFISKTNNKYFKVYNVEENLNVRYIGNFLNISLFFCFTLMLISWLFYGVGHSFLISINSEINISSLRFGISDLRESKLIKHLFIFISPLLTAIIASNIQNFSRLKKYFLLFCVLIIASWSGSKGPILTIFIVYVISNIIFKKQIIKISLRNIFITILGLIALTFLVFKIVLFQYSYMENNLNLFLDYFYQRVFVAQMIGVYEQFNLFIQNPDYILHGVPFASTFIDFPIFHKDLMLISEDRLEASSIGIKNTLFIAEAYGMGGILLLILSPFWIAFCFALNFKWMVFLTNKFIFKNIEYSKKIICVTVFSYVSITGGFSDLMFFKITILMTLLLLPFILINRIFNLKFSLNVK